MIKIIKDNILLCYFMPFYVIGYLGTLAVGGLGAGWLRAKETIDNLEVDDLQ
jgi:hypothetical protein